MSDFKAKCTEIDFGWLGELTAHRPWRPNIGGLESLGPHEVGACAYDSDATVNRSQRHCCHIYFSMQHFTVRQSNQLTALFAEICLRVNRNDLSERNHVRAEINSFRCDETIHEPSRRHQSPVTDVSNLSVSSCNAAFTYLSFSLGYVWVLKCHAGNYGVLLGVLKNSPKFQKVKLQFSLVTYCSEYLFVTTLLLPHFVCIKMHLRTFHVQKIFRVQLPPGSS